LKPTHGRIAVGSPYAGRAIGPLTRTAPDAALALSVMSGYDPRDHTSLPAAADVFEVGLDGLRVALLLDAGVGLPVDPEVTTAVSAAAAILEAAGATVEPIRPIITREMLDGLDHFWRIRSAVDIAALPEERRAKVLPQIREWVSTAADLTAGDVFHGYSQMGAMAAAVGQVFTTYDVILSPVAPITAFPAELAYPTDDPARPFEHIGFTVAYNMSHHPATTVNVGWSSSGLPIGAQLAVPHHQDLRALALADYLDTHRAESRPWPTPA
jgi:aspartyl-tRNA(Asn)/glutamyl-tRNA(Gln) amidotransferase subunit A